MRPLMCSTPESDGRRPVKGLMNNATESPNPNMHPNSSGMVPNDAALMLAALQEQLQQQQQGQVPQQMQQANSLNTGQAPSQQLNCGGQQQQQQQLQQMQQQQARINAITQQLRQLANEQGQSSEYTGLNNYSNQDADGFWIGPGGSGGPGTPKYNSAPPPMPQQMANNQVTQMMLLLPQGMQGNGNGMQVQMMPVMQMSDQQRSGTTPQGGQQMQMVQVMLPQGMQGQMLMQQVPMQQQGQMSAPQMNQQQQQQQQQQLQQQVPQQQQQQQMVSPGLDDMQQQGMVRQQTPEMLSLQTGRQLSQCSDMNMNRQVSQISDMNAIQGDISALQAALHRQQSQLSDMNALQAGMARQLPDANNANRWSSYVEESPQQQQASDMNNFAYWSYDIGGDTNLTDNYEPPTCDWGQGAPPFWASSSALQEDYQPQAEVRRKDSKSFPMPDKLSTSEKRRTKQMRSDQDLPSNQRADAFNMPASGQVSGHFEGVNQQFVPYRAHGDERVPYARQGPLEVARSSRNQGGARNGGQSATMPMTNFGAASPMSNRQPGRADKEQRLAGRNHQQMNIQQVATQMYMNGSGQSCFSAADTMKSQLQALQHEDPATVFIARRINKLGFSSADTIRNYFNSYGGVKGVFVSHSRVKSMRSITDRRSPDGHWRLRAAALGFVVMESPFATSQILQEGPEHMIQGVPVRVHAFHRRSCDKEEGEEGAGEGTCTDDDDEELRTAAEHILPGPGRSEAYRRQIGMVEQPDGFRDGENVHPITGQVSLPDWNWIRNGRGVGVQSM